MDNNIENNSRDVPSSFSKAIIAIIGIVIAIAILLGVLFMNSSKASTVAKLATSNQKITELFSSLKNCEQVNTTIKVDIDDIADKLELGNNDINLGKVKIKNVKISKEKDFSNTFTITADKDNSKFEMQIAKTNELVGFNLPEITSDFIAIDTSDTEELIEKLNEFGINYDNDVEVTEEEKEELVALFKKYINIAVPQLEDSITKTNNVEVSYGDFSEKATEYKVKITDKKAIEIALAVLEELNKNDKDIEFLLKYSNDKDMTTSDFKDKVKELIDEENDKLEELEDEEETENNTFVISFYEKSGKNIAIKMEYQGSVVTIYVFEKNKEYDVIYHVDNNEGNKISIIWHQEQTDSSTIEGKISFDSNISKKKYKFNICTFEVQGFKKAEDEIIKIDEDEAIMLNTISQEELNAELEKCMMNIQESKFGTEDNIASLCTPIGLGVYIYNQSVSRVISNSSANQSALEEMLQQQMVDEMMNRNDLNENDNYSSVNGINTDSNRIYINDEEDIDLDTDTDYFDDDFRRELNEALEKDINSTKKENGAQSVSGVTTSNILSYFIGLYNKVNVGMTKEEVIKVLGEPAESETYIVSEFLYYGVKINDRDYNNLLISLTDNKVSDVSIIIWKSLYSGINPAREVGMEIDDLNNEVGKIKEGMTFEEVEKILGKKHYESSKTESIKTIVWFDKNEKELSVKFDDENKVYNVSSIL